MAGYAIFNIFISTSLAIKAVAADVSRRSFLLRVFRQSLQASFPSFPSVEFCTSDLPPYPSQSYVHFDFYGNQDRNRRRQSALISSPQFSVVALALYNSVQASVFGFRISFGLRVSAFGFTPLSIPIFPVSNPESPAKFPPNFSPAQPGQKSPS